MELDIYVRVFCRSWEEYIPLRTLVDDARSHGVELELVPKRYQPEPEHATSIDDEEWQLATFRTRAGASVDLDWALAGDEGQAEENATFHREIDAADVDEETRAQLHAVVDEGLGVMSIDVVNERDLELALAIADSYVKRRDGTLQRDDKGFLLGDRWVYTPEEEL